MKNNKHLRVIVVALAAMVLYACTKSTDTVNLKLAKNYVSATKGKYIIYKLDSIVTRSFGSGFQTSTYTVKDSVVDVFTDNTGREAFKIFRYVLNANGTWTSSNTFVLTPTDNNVEYVENNLRYIKLVSPVQDAKEWKGNSYVNQSPFYVNTSFPNWTYKYTNIDAAKSYGTQNFAKTITVQQFDSAENKPFNKNVYNFYDKGYEVYAENVGLIYRDIMSWEYQVFTHFNNCKLIKPKASGVGNDTLSVDCNNPLVNCDSLIQRPNHKVVCDTIIDRYYYNGYGIKQTVLSHN
jgi:type II secretory pathway pseudopilin PulG